MEPIRLMKIYNHYLFPILTKILKLFSDMKQLMRLKHNSNTVNNLNDFELRKFNAKIEKLMLFVFTNSPKCFQEEIFQTFPKDA